MQHFWSKNQYVIYQYDKLQNTALHWATKRNHVEIAKFLIEKGCNVNTQDFLGRTPLFIASHMNHSKIAKAILRANPVINVKNVQGFNAYEIA